MHNGLQYSTVTNPTTHAKWLDRNLGASQVAISRTDELSFGDLYQWGRGTDGHEKRTSATTTTLSDTDTPGHGDFIITDAAPNDWRDSQNDSLWQGVDGINNPCPAGYRIPSAAEFRSWNVSGIYDAFNSLLKIPTVGSRYNSGASSGSFSANMWCNNFVDTYAQYFSVATTSSIVASERASGYSVRCIKHEESATSVSLDKANADMHIDEELQLTATVLPENASCKVVTWSSSNESVATVDVTGNVTAHSEGTAIITATTVDGGHTEQCEVTVTPPMSGTSVRCLKD
ncbi:MAG: Ig-like domain-containing protein [Euryarchaeota archaeon]|nr:Ig-like domain-containing protein [Euryarchaeota archaeon]